MTTMLEAAAAFEKGRAQYEDIMKGGGCSDFFAFEQYGEESEAPDVIGFGDNLEYMEYLLKRKNMAGKLQLIYADPPFFSKGKYSASFCLDSETLGKSSQIRPEAYDDRWELGLPEYLTMLTVRLFLMKELLSETGCIWVHLDRHAAHYVKLVMDAVFGEKNFVNEVIWTYKSGGAAQRSFARKHDTLLFYGKSGGYKFRALKEKSYNRGLKPYRFKGVEEFCDETGWYTLVNMKDVWSIDMVGRTSSERTGYATQKPEKLLERIVEACSDEGDLCADFFAGSGTLGAVCRKLGRRWLMCDEGELSVAGQVERMGRLGGSFVVEKRSLAPSRGASESWQDDASVPSRGASECSRGVASESRQGGASLEPSRGGASEPRQGSVSLEPSQCASSGPFQDGASETSQRILDIGLYDDKIELSGYRMDMEEAFGTLPEKSRVELEAFLREDSLSFIRCWSVDEDFDGIVHRGKKLLPGEVRSCRLKLQKGRTVSIAGYDALGGRFFKTIDI